MKNLEVAIARLEENLYNMQKSSDDKFKTLFDLFNDKIIPLCTRLETKTQANTTSIIWLRWGVTLIIGVVVSVSLTMALK